jgi:hypothetical protein
MDEYRLHDEIGINAHPAFTATVLPATRYQRGSELTW